MQNGCPVDCSRDLEIRIGLGCGERELYMKKEPSKEEWLNKQMITEHVCEHLLETSPV